MIKKVAIIGSGPAGLMAASVLSEKNIGVTVFEKRKSIGRKLLVAGSSGLNITNDLPLEQFVPHYTGPKNHWEKIIRNFTPKDWVSWIEGMGMPTFLGTSGRYFIEDKKAARFVKLWQETLIKNKVDFIFSKEWSSLKKLENGRLEVFEKEFDAVILALGGGSWEPQEKPLRWLKVVHELGIKTKTFEARNVGYQVNWSDAFLKKAEGKPIKNVVFSSSRGSKKGELMITRYGLEGTPVYFMGCTETVYLDLKPDLSLDQVVAKLSHSKENLSPMRRVQRLLNLCEGAQEVIFHMIPKEKHPKLTLESLAALIKKFPIKLGAPQPIDEAISSSGGVLWDELNDSLMVKKIPGLYCVGEMIDWDAPTGGFLLQGCVSQGKWVAGALATHLNK